MRTLLRPVVLFAALLGLCAASPALAEDPVDPPADPLGAQHAPLVEEPPPEPPSGLPPTDLRHFEVVLPLAEVAPGEPVVLRFSEPLVAEPGEQFWVTLVPPDAAPETYDIWSYVDEGAKGIELVPTRAGRFEVRLHAHYPAKAHHIIFRAPVEVIAKPR